MTAQIFQFTPIHQIVKDYPNNNYPRLIKSRIATYRILGTLGAKEAQYLVYRYNLQLSDRDRVLVA